MKLFYVDPNGVLSEHERVLDADKHYGLFTSDVGLVRLPHKAMHETRLTALEAQWEIMSREAKDELENIFLANARHRKLMRDLIELEVELCALRNTSEKSLTQ